ncbi:MAG: zeta toxin family protein [Rickettsiales bacterium]|jgi:hypothetical protein|nr:zeta toxin family protein [Rickettsiales bacterium]
MGDRKTETGTVEINLNREAALAGANKINPDQEILQLIKDRVHEEFNGMEEVGLVDGYKLNEEEMENMIIQIWKSQRYNDKLEKAKANEINKKGPVAVWLIGQPGAGKSVATKNIKESSFIDRKPASLDVDAYRVYHPKIREMALEDPGIDYSKNTYADLTHRPAVVAFDVLNHICTQKGIDQIIETSGSWKPAMPNQIFTAKQKGFKVKMATVVTKLEQSSLGADARVVMDLERGNPPRPVDEANKVRSFSNLYGDGSLLVDEHLLFGGGKCGREEEVDDYNYMPTMGDTHGVDEVEIYNREKLLKNYDLGSVANDEGKKKAIDDIRQCIVGELTRGYTRDEISDRMEQKNMFTEP